MPKSAPSKPTEVVFQEFPPAGSYRIRLVRDAELKDLVALDVREYVSGRDFQGFTRRGIRLNLPAMKKLKEALDVAITQLEVKS